MTLLLAALCVSAEQVELPRIMITEDNAAVFLEDTKFPDLQVCKISFSYDKEIAEPKYILEHADGGRIEVREEEEIILSPGTYELAVHKKEEDTNYTRVALFELVVSSDQIFELKYQERIR